jgi:hypothetical protein
MKALGALVRKEPEARELPVGQLGYAQTALRDGEVEDWRWKL